MLGAMTNTSVVTNHGPFVTLGQKVFKTFMLILFLKQCYDCLIKFTDSKLSSDTYNTIQ